MSVFEDIERKEKPETKEIVEKLDFQQIVWMQVNDCRILHIQAANFPAIGEDAYYASVKGLVSLLCGISDEAFDKQIEELREDVRKNIKWAKRMNAKHNGTEYGVSWIDHGFEMFKVCMKFIHAKGLGFTELKKEKI